VIATAAGARSTLANALELFIDDYLADLEFRVRSAEAASEGDRSGGLAESPDWRQISVEDVIAMRRLELEAWRDALLAFYDRQR
jgi:hypothetical protein